MNPSFPPAGVKVLSVGELTRQVKGLLEEAFDDSVWVAGEITNCKPASSGHIYLCLKDREAQIKAVIWRGIALRLRFDPRDGLDVIARGRLDVYAPHGEYKLVIEELQPRGLGARELALRQLREKLFGLGYFDPKRKKPLPSHPRCIALVTSPTGAAIRDMLEVLACRWPGAEVWVCPVRVQGDGAAEEIAAAVRRLNRLRDAGALAVDVMIIGRGGGSSDDLWAFNGECVAHAIFRSAIPVVSAVGHEIDVTIADLVADRRALTPTEAATFVVPDGQEVLRGLYDAELRLRNALTRRFERTRCQLDELAQRRVFRLPLETVRGHEQRLDDWADRLRRAQRQRIDRARERVEAHAARLETLSPLNVLARGYSLTRRAEDKLVVRNPEQVRPGDLLVTHVQHGQITSRVEEPAATTNPPTS